MKSDRDGFDSVITFGSFSQSLLVIAGSKFEQYLKVSDIKTFFPHEHITLQNREVVSFQS